MTQPQVAVAPARYDDHVHLGAALGAAFTDDPVFRWLIPSDVPRRDERLAAFFGSIARSYLRRDKNVYLASGAAGGALWSAPGSWSLPMTEVARETRSAVFSFGRNVTRALRCQLEIESKHPKDPKHWYLGYLGVAPEHQGQGVGAAMLSEVTDQADTEGTPAYLESSNERNLTLYERHGFRVVEEFSLLGKGPTVWRMWREPLG